MKKLKNSGFTLIELLAVITIMGILMMVAIPAVSRTIENSRRDTYANIIRKYIDAVRNAYLADNMKCQHSGKWVVASATPVGTYYVPICTSDAEGNCDAIGPEGSETMSAGAIVQSTADLLESGGKSSFGNADLKGYIKIEKVARDEKDDLMINYWQNILDSMNNGNWIELREDGDLNVENSSKHI